jgi:hypothetical protein
MRARTLSARKVLGGLCGAIVAAAVLGAPTSAQAAPEGAYPAPAPAIRVSAGSVTFGDAVRLSGKGFVAGEPISITVLYRITRHSGGYDGWGTRISGDRRAGDDGRFSARVRFGTPGYAIIKVTGKRSHKTLKVAVRVQAWENPWDDYDFFAGTPLGNPVRGHWDGHDRPVGFYGPFRDGWSPFRLQGNEQSSKAAVASGSAGTESKQPYGAELIPGLLGLTALIGSGLVGYRRRRTS